MSDKAISPTGIRMSDQLRSKLRQMAEANKRSMNAEVIYHLERVAFGMNENEKADAQRA